MISTDYAAVHRDTYGRLSEGDAEPYIPVFSAFGIASVSLNE